MRMRLRSPSTVIMAGDKWRFAMTCQILCLCFSSCCPQRPLLLQASPSGNASGIDDLPVFVPYRCAEPPAPHLPSRARGRHLYPKKQWTEFACEATPANLEVRPLTCRSC